MKQSNVIEFVVIQILWAQNKKKKKKGKEGEHGALTS